VEDSFLDDLLSVLYTDENVARANKYMQLRELESKGLEFPWVATGKNSKPFDFLGTERIPSWMYTECLYIPLIDVSSTQGDYPVGLDVRYIGSNPNRVRYRKIKRAKECPLLYNFHRARKSESIVLVEGAIDAESVRLLGYEALASLTALGTDRYAQMLYSLDTPIYVMFDNDYEGRKATMSLMKYFEALGALQQIKPIVYLGKDPNQAYTTYGYSYMKTCLNNQILLATVS
jgi:hypothetical protein